MIFHVSFSSIPPYCQVSRMSSCNRKFSIFSENSSKRGFRLEKDCQDFFFLVINSQLVQITQLTCLQQQKTEIYFRRMLIDREHYLQLLKKSEILTDQNLVLRRENEILSRQLQNQKFVNYELITKFRQMEEYSALMNERVMNQNDCLHHDLKGHTTVLHQKQQKFLEQKFKELETSSFQKYKLLEIRNTAKRIENHELLQFCQKVRKLYKGMNKNEKQPSFKDILKWIKQSKQKKQQEGTESGKKQNQTKSSWKNTSAK